MRSGGTVILPDLVCRAVLHAIDPLDDVRVGSCRYRVDVREAMADHATAGERVSCALHIGRVGEHQPVWRPGSSRRGRGERCRHGHSSGRVPDGRRPALRRTAPPVG